MEDVDIQPLLEDLTSNIDDLQQALTPLLNNGLSQSTSKLPLLDKAKVYVLATYAIESILFSSLRMNGVDAKAHPVFKELARVKEYFAKIKTAEGAGSKRNVTLDKDAAGRMVRHGLAGNERYDRERAQRMDRERAGAKRKLEDMSVGTNTRFEGVAKRIKAEDSGLSSPNTHTGTSDQTDRREVGKHTKFADSDDDSSEDATGAAPAQKKPKGSKDVLDSLLEMAKSRSDQPQDKKKKRKKKKPNQQRLEDLRADEMK